VGLMQGGTLLPPYSVMSALGCMFHHMSTCDVAAQVSWSRKVAAQLCSCTPAAAVPLMPGPAAVYPRSHTTNTHQVPELQEARTRFKLWLQLLWAVRAAGCPASTAPASPGISCICWRPCCALGPVVCCSSPGRSGSLQLAAGSQEDPVLASLEPPSCLPQLPAVDGMVGAGPQWASAPLYCLSASLLQGGHPPLPELFCKSMHTVTSTSLTE
jgi:hypothetical protein